MRKTAKAVSLAMLAAALTALLGTGTANAAPSSPTPQEIAAGTPMTFVPITSVSVPASGAATVLLANGKSLSIPRATGSALSSARATSTTASAARTRRRSRQSGHAANYSYGDCGYSWIFEEPNSNHSGAIVNTGYDVYSEVGEVYYFEWFFYGENYTYHRSFYEEYAGDPGTDFWNNPFYQALKGKGGYNGHVAPEVSYVLGTNGACFSGGPSTGTTV